MAQVQVEQAVFTSSNRGAVEGYQLVAKSPGIDERAAHVIRQWSPTHSALASKNISAQSINYFSIDKHRFAIGRTLYGLPEYSNRGSLQTVTQYLVTSIEHLQSFQGDVWTMYSIARSMGLLQFNPQLPPRLSTVALPATTILAGQSTASTDLELARRATHKLIEGSSVAVVGVPDPISTLRHIFFLMNVEQRLNCSFMTGLQHSTQRKFKLEFHESSDTNLRYQLSQEHFSIFQPEQKSPLFDSEPIIA